MKLMWLCNTQPGVVRSHIRGQAMSAVNWVDHVLSDLRRAGISVRILCPGDGEQGSLDALCSYHCFRRGPAHQYDAALEPLFRQEIRQYAPDVIHIWGTEYGHALAMARSAHAEGMPERTVASIQGLCSVYTRHFAEGVPHRIRRGSSFRDLLRRDNILQQREKYALRGRMEEETLKMLPHVIGRTRWDAACTAAIRPDRQYHFCNETLRDEFYTGSWSYDRCRKHQVFASSCVYPVKGFHYLLEAMGTVVKHYPDATVAVPGRSFFAHSAKEKLRRSRYEQYLAELAEKNGLQGKIEFLGDLSAEQMKTAYLSTNVFVLPSAIENSPNSLGEAMLLGVPCVAADVGGVTDLLKADAEGYVYQSTAPYMLSHLIQQVFALEDQAGELGRAARAHARRTHDPQTNLETLLSIYKALAGGGTV